MRTRLVAIQTDSQIGFSLASFIRQAGSLRAKLLADNFLQGRLRAPSGHWNRDRFQHSTSAAGVPYDSEHALRDGMPWLFSHYDCVF